MYRIAFIISLVIISAHTALGLPGSGTEAEPWRIETPADFDEFAADANYWPGYTRLETDVNLAGLICTIAFIAPDTNILTSGFQGNAFTGVFDGNDHKITNLTIRDRIGRYYLGLFGYINGGEVRNLGLESVSISGIGGCVGGLVGCNASSITNCYSTGNVKGLGDYVGGLVGKNRNGSVSYCYSTSDVSGCWYVGGLMGGNHGHSGVSDSYSTGDVNGLEAVGGLVGLNGSEGILIHIPGYIYNSYSTGAVEGLSGVGGLVGVHIWGIIEESFWDIETSGQIESDGGTGKTTAEMQTKSTFTDASWDFEEIWNIGERQTYPYLRRYLSADLNHDGRVNMLDFAILAGHWLNGAGG